MMWLDATLTDKMRGRPERVSRYWRSGSLLRSYHCKRFARSIAELHNRYSKDLRHASSFASWTGSCSFHDLGERRAL